MAAAIEVPSVPGHVLVRRTPGAGPVYIPMQTGVGQFHPVLLVDHAPTVEEQDAYDLPVVAVWHLEEQHARERSDFQVIEPPQTRAVTSKPAPDAAEVPAEDGA